MPLQPGSKIGPYEVLSKIGAGGMGEVYKARDNKLNREVAIKVLPAALANDADYLARFQREAQALAALHHPNIATIFGLEQNAIVMEYVEGAPLQGPLPIAEALPIAKQIAEALEAAHEKGIIHRDLKPANILLTPDGQVKILDFGLAKAVERTNATSANSPTLTLRATEAGLILGTAAYMAPEQAAGKPVDRRADIWSFGVVLYELLTGKQLFDGETVSHTLAEVLKTEIDFNKIPAGPLRQLLQRCLDRNLKNRLQHIGEARFAIENYREPAVSAAPPPKRNWLLPVACLAVTTVAVAWALFRAPAATAVPALLELNPPNGVEFTSIFNNGGSAISPDGKTLAFIGVDQQGDESLYVRPRDSMEARQLPGTLAAARPFWSPDSKSIAFFAGGKMKRTELSGGLPVSIADSVRPRGASWNSDGAILYVNRQGGGILRVPAAGGTPAQVTTVDEKAGETHHYYPHFLPDGKRFLVLIRYVAEPGKNHIALGSLDGSPPVKITTTQYKASYDPQSGSLLYIPADGKLVAQRLELSPPRLAGEPIEIATNIGTTNNNSYADFSNSNNGVLFYGRSGRTGAKARFTWRDRTGVASAPIGAPGPITYHYEISPDGTRLAYTGGDQIGFSELSLMDLANGRSLRIPSSSAATPHWAPDGKHLYFTNREGIHRVAADGSGPLELVWKGERNDRMQSISPDGKFLLFGLREINLLPLSGERKPERWADGDSAAISPDGRWVAYQSDESGRTEVYLQRLLERTGRQVVSSGGGREPEWRGDGRELYWIGAGGRLNAAAVTLQADDIKVAPPEALFVVDGRPGEKKFQPSRDGKRFLIHVPVDDEKDSPAMVVRLNAIR
jgi:Tol biopolymer transport system component/tRNA A-37 threonylcarbamoyl transferase component Bud32